MLIPSLLLAAAPVTPSFDCSGLLTAVEGTICADADLAVRDRALGLVYRKVPKVFTRIGPAQRRWLTERNRCRTRECLLLAYDRRLAQLASTFSFAESLRHESYSGHLSIVPIAADWHLFSVGKAGTNTLGEIVMAQAAGLIRVEGGAGRWQVDSKCALLIARSGTRWRVTHDQACAQAFSGLSLNGLYLTEAEWWTAPDIEAAQPPRAKLSR